jgi:hypothetical protein
MLDADDAAPLGSPVSTRHRADCYTMLYCDYVPSHLLHSLLPEIEIRRYYTSDQLFFPLHFPSHLLMPSVSIHKHCLRLYLARRHGPHKYDALRANSIQLEVTARV